MSGSSSGASAPLSKRTWFIVLWLILFFPVGLILVWRSDWPDTGKLAAYVLTAFVVILAVFSPKDSDLIEPMPAGSFLPGAANTTSSQRDHTASSTIEPSQNSQVNSGVQSQAPATAAPESPSASSSGGLKTPDSASNASQKQESPVAAVYVLNTNTKKIHYATCASAKKIKAENYAETSDFSAAIANGYQPCGNCHPQ